MRRVLSIELEKQGNYFGKPWLFGIVILIALVQFLNV